MSVAIAIATSVILALLAAPVAGAAPTTTGSPTRAAAATAPATPTRAATAPATPTRVVTAPATPTRVVDRPARRPTRAGAAAAVPEPGVCVDQERVLGPQTCTLLAAILAADEKATTDEIAVLVVPTTGGRSIESYALEVFNDWGVGKAGKDNGVLLVVALQDRTVRIEVGTGLEKTLTDGDAREIISGTLLPAFRQSRYRTGILAGLDAIRKALGHPMSTRTMLVTLPADSGAVTPTAVPTYRPGIADTDPGYDDTGYPGSSADRASERSDGSATLWIVLLLVLAVGSWAWSAYSKANGNSGGDDGSGSSYTRRRRYSSFSSRSNGSSSSRSSSSGGSRRSSFGGGRSRGGGGSGSW